MRIGSRVPTGAAAVAAVQGVRFGARVLVPLGALGCYCATRSVRSGGWSSRVPPDAAGICLLPSKCAVKQILAIWGLCLHVLLAYIPLLTAKCSPPKNIVKITHNYSCQSSYTVVCDKYYDH